MARSSSDLIKEEFLAKGKRGIVYRGLLAGKEIAIKEINPESKAINRLENEAHHLKLVNQLGIGPKLLGFNKHQLLMEYIDGERILDFLERAEKKDIQKVLILVFEQMRKLDKLGINKLEMTYPYKHIVIRKMQPILLDFERCKHTLRPKNVTQFCQFIVSIKVGILLKSKGLEIEKKKILKAAEQYKKNYSEKNFKAIVSQI